MNAEMQQHCKDSMFAWQKQVNIRIELEIKVCSTLTSCLDWVDIDEKLTTQYVSTSKWPRVEIFVNGQSSTVVDS